jgi:3-methylfumaryl-CoA hydratase
MFAGGSVEFLRPLIVGQRVHREDTVLSVTPKSGARGGDFVVVAVQTRLFDSSGALAVQEVQDLIYRDKPAPAEEPLLDSVLDIVPLLLHKEERWEFRTDPTKLMRFSAATSNGHRIHYDHPYATGVEGYPGLVVHGPLMTLALAEVLRSTADCTVTALRHRNMRPLFCGQLAYVESSDDALVLTGPAGPCVRLAVSLC